MKNKLPLLGAMAALCVSSAFAGPSPSVVNCAGITPHPVVSPSLYMSDGVGDTITLDSANAGASMGNIQACTNNVSFVTGSGGPTAGAGAVGFIGFVGTVQVSIDGTTPPTLSNQIDLNSLVQNTAATGTVTFTIRLSDKGFTTSGTTTLSAGGSSFGGANGSFNAYADGTNTLCVAQTTCPGFLGTTSVNGGAPNGGSLPMPPPYSLTEELVYSLPGGANSDGGGSSGNYNLLIDPSAPATGCPATKGFWKNHAFPNSLTSMTIGGVTYTAAQLKTILGENGGNAVAIMGSQLVAALVNIYAGAQTTTAGNAAIATAQTLLSTGIPGHNPPAPFVFPINMTTESVAPSSVLGNAMTTVGDSLNNYNSDAGLKCSEAAGLTTGTGK